ncbi:MAG: hypothetical protein AAGA93_12630 [Actinomycetota bacterium]
METTTSNEPRTIEEVRAFAVGHWESLTVELRPTEDRAGTGAIEPTRLRRRFHYRPDDTFTGVISQYGDDYGELHLLDFEFKGHLVWGGPHPIADGAFEIDYVLDEAFAVTPVVPDIAAMLNQGRPADLDEFAPGVRQDILGKAFPLFDIAAGQILTDYDLVYFVNGLLFMGAKHVDGTPFDQPERRPHQLQIPLVRVTDDGASS